MNDEAVKTPSVHLPDKFEWLKPYAWRPGQSGNPAGRPKGSRSKLSEDFLADWFEDYQQHGKEVIARVREKHPDKYFEGLHKLLPKDIKVDIPILNKIIHEIVDPVQVIDTTEVKQLDTTDTPQLTDIINDTDDSTPTPTHEVR